jgi:hypothetical protein
VNLDLRPSITRLGAFYTVRRGSAPTIADGFATPGSATEITRRILFQPASAKDLQLLPEGRRSVGAAVAFATEDLRTEDVDTGASADIIVREDGSEWEVVLVDDWLPQGNYWRALAQRVGR